MSVWDKLTTHSQPINRQTALAVSGGCGHDVSLPIEPHHVYSDVPLKITTPPLDAPDFVGQKIGRLRVIGWASEHTGTHGLARWVVRCDCGAYELRRSRVLRRHNEDHCCKRCDKLNYVRELGSSTKRLQT